MIRNVSSSVGSTTSLALFVALALAISWLGYLPSFANAEGIRFFRNPVWQVCLLLTGTGPTLAAWAATAYEKPTATVGNRLYSGFVKTVPAVWWFTAALLPAALLVTANTLARVAHSGGVAAVPPASVGLILVTSIVSIAANPFEEIGWRGFALFRLETRFVSLVAALMTSVVTVLWHVPLFLLPQSPMHTYPFWVWTTGSVTHSILLTWLYNVSSRSLSVTSLFHVSFNIFGAILGTRTFVVLAGVELTAVVLLLLVLGPSLGRATGLPNHAK